MVKARGLRKLNKWYLLAQASWVRSPLLSFFTDEMIKNIIVYSLYVSQISTKITGINHGSFENVALGSSATNLYKETSNAVPSASRTISEESIYSLAANVFVAIGRNTVPRKSSSTCLYST